MPPLYRRTLSCGQCHLFIDVVVLFSVVASDRGWVELVAPRRLVCQLLLLLRRIMETS